MSDLVHYHMKIACSDFTEGQELRMTPNLDDVTCVGCLALYLAEHWSSASQTDRQRFRDMIKKVLYGGTTITYD